MNKYSYVVDTEDKNMSHHHEHTHEGCSCGHNHSHEHEHHHHEHGACSCGHDHSHEHEHHHHHHEGCSCGHDHHHEEERHHEHVHASSNAKKKIYILENLGCANCAAKMERKINELPEVELATITFATKQLCVASDHQENILPKLQEICASVESEVVVRPKEEEQKVEKEDHKKEFVEIGLGVFFFVAGILCGKFAELPSIICFVLGYLILGREVLLTACKNMLKGQVFDENFLMSLATVAAFCIGEWTEAVGVMLFFRVGELFEHIAVERSRNQIMEAVDMRPEVVNLVHGREVHIIAAKDAKVGDIVLVRPGDRIPLDGLVVQGESRIDTAPVTGESVPVKVEVGANVISGCVNLSGAIQVEVEKALEDSMVTRILNSVENAAASKPRIDRFITRFARVYTPFVVALAIATAIIPSLITGEWSFWIYTAITFLVISCPCALVLSVPLAFYSGIGAASKKGILFKGGYAIEALNHIKTVVMDKTGTITKGNFEVQAIVPEGSLSEHELLELAASCEMDSLHPIADSIVRAAKEHFLDLKRAESVEEISGKGIRAVLDRKEVLCGNKALMELHHVDMKEHQEAIYGTEVFVAVNDQFAGYMVIADTIKSEAKEAIKALRNQNLKTVMLTGDTEIAAKKVAKDTGVEHVYAQLLPDQKLEKLVEARAKYGAAMFVGDGINDAPVLAGADVGAAMGSGADAAIEAADLVFMTSAVDAIPESIALSKATCQIAMQNVVFALAIKALVMLLGLFGFANMWMAVFADTGVAMLCILNSIRILRRK